LKPLAVDVIFPIVHGKYGEDGTLQGMLELLHIPYVGTHTLGSAINMDKIVTKHILRSAELPVVRWLEMKKTDQKPLTYEEAVAILGAPLFIKPANTGSSVGVSKVKNAAEFQTALTLAHQYDDRIIIEEFISAREIECSVLGDAEIAV